MRYLICEHCRFPALASKERGLLACAGQLSQPVVRVPCQRCGKTTIITSQDFARQSEMTRQQIASDTCDLPGDAS